MEKTSQELIDLFSTSVIKQAACIQVGDAENGNKHAEAYISAAKSLLAGGDQVIDEFAALLRHKNRDVRGTAAAFLLKDRTKSAVNTLRKLRWGWDLASLGAKHALKRYKEGNLEIR